VGYNTNAEKCTIKVLYSSRSDVSDWITHDQAI